MSRLLSDRAGKTDQVVVLPSSLEDPNKPVAGLYKVGLAATCFSIAVSVASLVIAYYWRSSRPPFWAPIVLPATLSTSTVIILLSSVTFEAARRYFRKGRWRLASQLLLA